MPRPLVLLAFAALAAASASAQHAPATSVTLAGLSDRIAFVENRGQWPGDVLFRADLGGGIAWVTRNGVVFDFYEVQREEQDADALPHEAPEAMRRRGHVVRMRFEGGHARRAIGHGRQAAYHNYFLGDDPARWAARVPLYDEVVLEGLYDGVDLRLYDDDGFLRYDLVLEPGADVSQVWVRVEGSEDLALVEGGALRMATALGAVEHRGLLAYQEGTRGREEVGSTFVVGADGTVGFRVTGADPARRLVLDPLVWATFLGGGSSDSPYGIASWTDGSVTVVGSTTSHNFPVTPGAYATSHNGDYDAYVARLSPDGSGLMYATFLGGSDREEVVMGIAVGADGSTTVAGDTRSSDFPTTPGAYDASHNGSDDAFVTRLSPDGASVTYSTYLGGESHDDLYGIALDADGSVTLVGGAGSSFPVTPGAYDTSHNGSYSDAFVTRLSPDGSALLFSTFLGGTSSDNALAVAVGADGSATVSGRTTSADFPATPGAYDTSYNNDWDAFVARLSPDGSALLFSTFLGGTDREYGNGIPFGGLAIGADGAATIVGKTESADFPTTPGAYDTAYDGGGDAFVARLAPDGSTLLFSTYLGGTADDAAFGIVLDVDGDAVVVGYTDSPEFPTTPGAFGTSHNGRADAFVTRLSAGGEALRYSTFLGGTGSESARAIALSADERVVVTGSTSSANFPVTPGAFNTTSNDAYVAQLDVSFAPFALAAVVLTSPVPRGERLRFTVTFANNAPDPFNGSLVLGVESQGGTTATRLLVRNATLPPGQVASPTFSLRVPVQAPLGLYTATLTALEGGTDPLAEATFVFRVDPQALQVIDGGHASTGSTPWVLAVLNGGGLDGLTAPAADASAPAAAVGPNPASSNATVAFTLRAPSDVRLALYDVLGREVAALDAGRLAAGPHRLALDLSALPAGVYVWRLTAGERVETGRLTVAR